MAVTLTQLNAFLAVVRRGSVTAAAEELVVTQPSVSAAVAALERELGAKLTERDGRGLKPTAAGRAFAPYAEHALGLLEQGGRAAREAVEDARRTLRVSAVATAGEHFAPLLIKAFAEQHPELVISLDVGNRADVFQRLVEREVDVGITGRVPDDPWLRGCAFAPNDFVLVAAPSDPLAKRQAIEVEELSDCTWLVREEGSGTRALCLRYLAAHKLHPNLLTLGSNGAIRQAARFGLGIALISRIAVEVELQHGLLAELSVAAPLPRRAWHVIYVSNGPVRPEVEAFVDFLQSNAGRHVLARASEA
jgi:LysR family transcriptional regulator, low CO2-responsive transcriptional regulator